MRIKLRLYIKYDYDLVVLFFNEKKQFAFRAINALEAATCKQKYTLPWTSSRGVDNVLKNVTLDLSISDLNVISMLESVPSGQRNMFVKTMIRNSIPYIPAQIFTHNMATTKKIVNTSTKDSIQQQTKRQSPSTSVSLLPTSPYDTSPEPIKQDVSKNEVQKKRQDRLHESETQDKPSQEIAESIKPIIVEERPEVQSIPASESEQLQSEDLYEDLNDLFSDLDRLSHGN